MATSLRLLLIEDNENDALLLLRELRRGGLEIFSRRIQTANELATALETEHWDAIISDWVMPGFSGMEALLIVRRRCDDLPFILVSGKIGEVSAVEAMKAGANDYLMKENLARLAPALQREIQEHHNRRADKDAIRQAHQELEQRVTQRTTALAEVNVWLTREIADRRHAEETLKEDSKRLLEIIQTQYEIARETPEPRRVMNLIAERAQRVARGTGAVVALLEGEDLVLQAATGTAIDCVGLRVARDYSLSELSIREGKALRCDDVETDPRVDLELCRKMGARSVIAVPLQYNRSIVGVLKVLSSELGAFTDHDLHTLELMAGQLAAAIAHAAEFSARQNLLSERTSTLNAVSESEQRLHLALQASRTGTWTMDTKAGTVTWDEIMLAIMGTSSEAFGGRYEDVVDCIHPDDRAKFNASVDRMLADNISYDNVLKIVWPDATIRFVSWSGQASFNGDGSLTGVCLDVTERQGMLDDLACMKNAAEAANRSKSEFLANMSHEIRTPMAAIIGHADMLLDTALSQGERLDAITTIRRQGGHLLMIINDILDLSKIEAGKMDVEWLDCNPCHIADDVASLMRVGAIERGIHLDLHFQGKLPHRVRTDPTRLRQILVNLVGNAIKFTKTGGVQIVVSLRPRNESGDLALQFEVIDSGMGMTEAQLEALFRPFKQGDNSTTRRFGGTGLGLTIAKRLATMLNGDIEVSSTVGVGSRFVLSIPTGDLDNVSLEKGQEAVRTGLQENSQIPPTLSGTVLLAEDGPANQRVISYYLQRAGMEVTIAANGRIACETMAAAMTVGTPFDLVLMDMQMPELDGYGAAHNLREHGYQGPIIALTAHAMAHDRQKCLQAGCSDYLAKPVDRLNLLKAVAAALAPLSLQPVPPDKQPIIREPVRSTLGSGDDVRAFLPLFLAELPDHVKQLSNALLATDYARLAEVVHQLKGTGGVYGFSELSEIAGRLEVMIHDEIAVDDIARELKALTDMVQRIEGYPEEAIAVTR